MQINSLKRKNKNKKDRLIGRGGKHAKTAGRGGKGQTARAGNKRRPALRDIIKKIPKKRGCNFKSRKAPFLIDKEKLVVGGKIQSFSTIRQSLKIKGSKIKIK